MLSDEDLADIIHGAHARLNARLGDPYSDEPHAALPGWHREMLARRVRLIRQGCSPADVQADWVECMLAQGWKPGPVKDLEKKEHPNLRDYAELDLISRRKVLLAFRIVYALTMEH
jgi:hypothetical protein